MSESYEPFPMPEEPEAQAPLDEEPVETSQTLGEQAMRRTIIPPEDPDEVRKRDNVPPDHVGTKITQPIWSKSGPNDVWSTSGGRQSSKNTDPRQEPGSR